MADCHVSGLINSSSQQQWITRNTNMSSWSGGVWNMVFVGCPKAPMQHCGNTGGHPYTTVPSTIAIAEKPYLIFDNNAYYLMVPPLERNKVGASTPFDQGNKIDFSHVYIAQPKTAAADINAQLNLGMHVILTPGQYELEESIHITHPNTIILGLGFPTLISSQGTPCITVDNVDGVKIGGVLLQAGAKKAETLLVWGQQQQTGNYPGNEANPGCLYDCFARVGGTNAQDEPELSADIMVQINSGHVICDNLWLWRADHQKTTSTSTQRQVKNGRNPCKIGFQANGNDLIAYGLASEHTLENLTEWNGDRGSVYFYQSEFPYDVQPDYGTQYVGYKVNDAVSTHNAWGVGVYCFFRDIKTKGRSCLLRHR